MPTTSVVKATDVSTPLMPFSSLPPTVPSRRRKRRDIPHYQETEAGTLPHKYVGTSRVPVVPRSTIPLIYQVICIYAKYPKKRVCDTLGTWHIEYYICFPFMEKLFASVDLLLVSKSYSFSYI